MLQDSIREGVSLSCPAAALALALHANVTVARPDSVQHPLILHSLSVEIIKLFASVRQSSATLENSCGVVEHDLACSEYRAGPE
jgi:hypothetical protein